MNTRVPSMELSADEQKYFETGVETEAEKEPGEEEIVASEEGEKEKPEAEAEKKPKEAEKAKETPQMVDKKAMDAERERRKRVEKEKQQQEVEHQAKLARLEERLALLNAAFQPDQKPEPVAPAAAEDPIAALEHLQQRFNQFTQNTVQQQKAQEQAQRQQAAMAQLEGAYRADAAQFAEQTPDFMEAYQFLVRSRQQELARLPGLRNNPAALAQAARQDELAIVQRALQARESPAEVLYDLAQIRGWKPKGAEAPRQAQQQPKESAVAEITRLTQAQEASASLSKGGGSANGSNAITLDALDRMSDDELKSFIQNKNRKDPHGYDKWMEKQMVGGR